MLKAGAVALLPKEAAVADLYQMIKTARTPQPWAGGILLVDSATRGLRPDCTTSGRDDMVFCSSQ